MNANRVAELRERLNTMIEDRFDTLDCDLSNPEFVKEALDIEIEIEKLCSIAR